MIAMMANWGLDCILNCVVLLIMKYQSDVF